MTERDISTTDAGRLEADGSRLIYVIPQEAVYDRERDSLDFMLLLHEFWRSKWLILGIALLSSLLGVAYALAATEWYRSEVLLAPVERDDSGLSGGQLGGLGGLASLAGLELGGGESAQALAVFRSRDFTRAFIEERDLMPVLYAELWDKETGRWLPADPAELPDIREAIDFFNEQVRFIEEDPATGMTVFAIEWTDPEVAARWARTLVDRINSDMRGRALAESARNLSYLKTQLQDVGLASMRASIGSLLETELQKEMLARGRVEYAYQIIDGPEVPLRRERPYRTLIVILAGFFGGLLALTGVLVRFAIRYSRQSAAA